MKFDRVNRNAVELVLKAGVFHLRLYASRPQPFQGWGNHCLRGPKVAATATLGWRMEPLCGYSSKSALPTFNWHTGHKPNR